MEPMGDATAAATLEREMEAALVEQSAGSAKVVMSKRLLRLMKRWSEHHFIVPLLRALTTGQQPDEALDRFAADWAPPESEQGNGSGGPTALLIPGEAA